MNSTDEISKYKEPAGTFHSPTLSRRINSYGYDLPEKSTKKEKKWSLGSLFRRKKKDDTETSSDEESQKRGFLRKKRKPDKKKKPSKPVGTFDHVVISRNSHLFSNGFNSYEDIGILSDPSGGFNSYSNRAVAPQAKPTKPIEQQSSVDNLSKKNRKGCAKVRAEARRDTLKQGSSSDEDSQRSVSSSRFRSDESIGIGLQKESSFSRRSRAARTERYLKRHSRDGENPNNYLRLSKSDVENSVINWKTSDESNRSLSRSPLVPKLALNSHSSSQSTNLSGLSTIPPSHIGHRVRVSNSTSNPSYKPPLSINDYNYSTRKLPSDYFNNQRSISCDANIHKAPSPDVMHAQFPIKNPNRFRNFSMIDPRQVNSLNGRQPPPPPPRDPRRLVTAQYYDNARPCSYLDGSSQARSKSFNTSHFSQPPQTKKFNSFNLHPSCRSTSEDYLPKSNVQLVPRPSSATPEASKKIRSKVNPETYNYLTDKKPRSRKPIFIKSNQNITDDKSETRKAADFWKRKDHETSPKPQMFTCQTHVQTQIFLPSVLPTETNLNSSDSLVNEFKPISPKEKTPPETFQSNQVVDEEELKRKSTNLEEALDELEAIYNSLRLGDEDLLERAEQREKEAAAQKIKASSYNINSGFSRGTLSDSSFSYEPFDTVDSPRRRRFLKKSQTVDRRTDDMAFRKQQRSATINDPQSMLARLSYLQASPIYGDQSDSDSGPKNANEPDITLDDVVYRNVKYANNSSPKVVEPQPPFGIPLGPITLAANSDYLHAVPDEIPVPTFKRRKIPDIVKDDLAYRNLRKDQSKEPALPQLSSDDLKNNNACDPKIDLNSLKKKRAVRSLSANIGSLISQDVLARGLEKQKLERENEFKNLSDIADAMEIARQVLREKESKITATRKGFLSDTDTRNGNVSIRESRMNFLNSLKAPFEPKPVEHYLQAKPPRGLTPERKSPRTTKESTPIPLSPLEVQDDGSSLEDLLTAFATEARETSDRITNELAQLANEPNGKNEVDRKLSDIDAVSEQAKLCEKLLEGVMDTAQLTPDEEVKQISPEPIIMESVANIVLTRDKTAPVAICESDHDYENLKSDEELHAESKPDGPCTSPFEDAKAELIASFQELKTNTDDLRATGEPCVDVVDGSASASQECARVDFVNPNTCLVPTNHKRQPFDVEFSSGLHSNSSEGGLSSLEGLKSPRLVLESSKMGKSDARQILENQSMIWRTPGTPTPLHRRVDREPGHILDDARKPFAWYRDPTTVAVACSYGVACAHQLYSLDFVAILGILFAVLSFIAALILRF